MSIRLQAVKARLVGVGDLFGVLTDVDGRLAMTFHRVVRASDGPRTETRDGYFRSPDIYIEAEGIEMQVCRSNDRVIVAIPGA